MTNDIEVKTSTDTENQASVENENENRDADLEQETEREVGPEATEQIFEDGFLAEMYRMVENGNEDCAPGWSKFTGFHKNR